MELGDVLSARSYFFFFFAYFFLLKTDDLEYYSHIVLYIYIHTHMHTHIYISLWHVKIHSNVDFF